MNAQLQLRIQRYGWDRATPFYDDGWQEALRPAQNLLFSMAAPQPGERVIDIAAGTGLISLRAARAVGPGGRVFATDISEGMLKQAAAQAHRAGLENISFGRMEAEALNCPDGYFDLALNALGLMYVTDVPAAMNEMHRSLKADGRAVAAVWGRRDKCGWAEIFPIVDARVNTDVCPLFFQLGTGNNLMRAFERANFRKIRCKLISTYLYYPSAEAACSAVFAGGPVAMAYSRFDEATKREAEAEYIDSIAAYRKEGAYFIPGEFVVVSGYK